MLEKLGCVKINVVIIFQLLPNIHRYLRTKKLSNNIYYLVRLDRWWTVLADTNLFPLIL
jgi:hypothetical protein